MQTQHLNRLQIGQHGNVICNLFFIKARIFVVRGGDWLLIDAGLTLIC
jgi:hypothetical protein